MLLLLAALLAVPAPAQKLGLASHFGDVTVARMEPGKAYNLKKLKGHGYALRNLSEVPVELVVEALPPLEGTLRPLYEPLPDPSWVKVTPARGKLGPQEVLEGEVVLKVPDDPQWKDRHFQCVLYAHTVEGSFLNVGMYDKLFFSTGPSPEERLATAPKVDWVPQAVKVGKVKAGAAYDSTAGAARLRLRNATGSPQRVRVESASFPEGTRPAKGYRPAADPAGLEFPEPEFELAAGQVREVPFRVKVPPQGQKRTAWLVRGTWASGSTQAQVLVEDAPAPPTRKPAGGKP